MVILLAVPRLIIIAHTERYAPGLAYKRFLRRFVSLLALCAWTKLEGDDYQRVSSPVPRLPYKATSRVSTLVSTLCHV